MRRSNDCIDLGKLYFFRLFIVLCCEIGTCLCLSSVVRSCECCVGQAVEIPSILRDGKMQLAKNQSDL